MYRTRKGRASASISKAGGRFSFWKSSSAGVNCFAFIRRNSDEIQGDRAMTSSAPTRLDTRAAAKAALTIQRTLGHCFALEPEARKCTMEVGRPRPAGMATTVTIVLASAKRP